MHRSIQDRSQVLRQFDVWKLASTLLAVTGRIRPEVSNFFLSLSLSLAFFLSVFLSSFLLSLSLRLSISLKWVQGAPSSPFSPGPGDVRCLTHQQGLES